MGKKRLTLELPDTLASRIDEVVTTGRAPSRTAYIVAALENNFGLALSIPESSSRSRTYKNPDDVVEDNGLTVRENQEALDHWRAKKREFFAKRHFGLIHTEPWPTGHPAATWDYSTLEDLDANGLDISGLN